MHHLPLPGNPCYTLNLERLQGRPHPAPPPYLEVPHAPRPLAPIPNRSSGRRLLAFCLLAALAAPGCGHEEKSHYSSVSKPPSVRIIQPEVRKIVRVVGPAELYRSI